MDRARSRGDSRDDRGSSRDRDDRGSSRGRDRDADDDRSSRRGGGRESSSRGSSSRGYSYAKRSVEQVNKRAAMGGKDFDSFIEDGVPVWKINDGANTIRILPPTWDKPDHYGLDVWVHYGVGPDEQSYLCAQKMKGEPCPVCDERDRARRDREDEDYIKELEPTRRVLVYLVDREHESNGVQVWASPWTIDRDITKVSVDRRTQEVLPIDDPEDGYDVEFDRTGKGRNTKYVGVAIARRESPLGKREWLDFAVDKPLPTILVYHDYDHIAKVLGGGGSHRTRVDKDDSRDTRGRDRDEKPSRDDRDDRGRGREREARSSHGADSKDDALTWDSIHAMEGPELDALVDEEKLDLNPDKFDSDADLADAICDAMNIKDEPPPRRGSSRREEKPEPDARERLRGLRDSRRD